MPSVTLLRIAGEGIDKLVPSKRKPKVGRVYALKANKRSNNDGVTFKSRAMGDARQASPSLKWTVSENGKADTMLVQACLSIYLVDTERKVMKSSSNNLLLTC